jgi:hypothetical protein
MTEIKTTEKGISYLPSILKNKKQTVTKAVFFKIPHTSNIQDVALKIGRYCKANFGLETLENEKPKSELTLDNEELNNLIDFLSDNFEPLKNGVKKYIPIDDTIDFKNTAHLKAIFANPNKNELLDFIATNDILPDDLIKGVEYKKRLVALYDFKSMLESDLKENEWQKWFKDNSWILGSEFIKIIDERDIDTENISDYLMQAYDGFLDIVEIKRPGGGLKFWSDSKDHNNYVPSQDLVKAISQVNKYIFEIEREANSVKFLERVGYVKSIKPRSMIIFGRSNNWNEEQKIDYRILNSSYCNLSILTYDHVLERAKRILNIHN